MVARPIFLTESPSQEIFAPWLSPPVSHFLCFEALKKLQKEGFSTRELLTGLLYYACTIMLCCTVNWRTSPIAIAAICNLCAWDGFADIIGRRFGKKKLLYNKDKFFAGPLP
ncbi:hypothetical protein L2E82_47403 [Cichorium intybus]|uniref:Uncharacterized protein n=1 Tax=Cichorium intybus TaxID=13427 RepID=A0ACB8YW39_CICIN|nr:hypothetical protein L2E82_47403 [Cichorium intybus]